MLSKKNNKKGFTLMEMLIVVAIIVILIAIMIPTFNSQLEKSREAADAANIRAAYAQVMVEYLDAGEGKSATVTLQQSKADWQTPEIEDKLEALVGEDGTYAVEAAKGAEVTVAVDDSGVVSITTASTDTP